MSLLKIIWSTLPLQLKKKFYIVLFFQCASAIFELLVVGFLYKYVQYLLNPELILISDNLDFIINNRKNPIYYISIIFTIIIIMSLIIKIILLKISNNFAFDCGCNTSLKLYKSILYKPFSFHNTKNSSELINLVFSKTNTVIYELILPILVITSTLFMIIGIVSALFYINYKATLLMLLISSLVYILIFKLSNKLLVKNGHLVNSKADEALKSLQEGLKTIKHIIIDNTYFYFINEYNQKNIELRNAQSKNLFLAALPKSLVDSLALIILVVTTFVMFVIAKQKLEAFIPILVAVVLSIQRLLPGMHQMYHAIATIRGVAPSLVGIEHLFKNHDVGKFEKQHTQSKIEFNEYLKIEGLSFKYNDKLIVNNFNLKVRKGQNIGICGKTGVGKSTLVDLIMGLHKPDKGKIIVDDDEITNNKIVSYRKLFSHVDQNTFLIDGSIEKNIAFGIEKDKIDRKKLLSSVNDAQALKFINDLPCKFLQRIGEDGSNLSGGERQRLSLARALYKDTEILILDEFTSSLDHFTEKSILDSIYSMNKKITVFMIAHRLDTLNQCDIIIELFENANYKVHENRNN